MILQSRLDIQLYHRGVDGKVHVEMWLFCAGNSSYMFVDLDCMRQWPGYYIFYILQSNAFTESDNCILRTSRRHKGHYFYSEVTFPEHWSNESVESTTYYGKSATNGVFVSCG